MVDGEDLRAVLDLVWGFVPPAIGAWFGLREAIGQGKHERITTFAASTILAFYLGQAIGEYWSLGKKSTSGVAIIVAILLSDITGAVIAAVRQWRADPAGTFKRWLDAWLGRGGGS